MTAVKANWSTFQLFDASADLVSIFGIDGAQRHRPRTPVDDGWFKQEVADRDTEPRTS